MIGGVVSWSSLILTVLTMTIFPSSIFLDTWLFSLKETPHVLLRLCNISPSSFLLHFSNELQYITFYTLSTLWHLIFVQDNVHFWLTNYNICSLLGFLLLSLFLFFSLCVCVCVWGNWLIVKGFCPQS